MNYDLSLKIDQMTEAELRELKDYHDAVLALVQRKLDKIRHDRAWERVTQAYVFMGKSFIDGPGETEHFKFGVYDKSEFDQMHADIAAYLEKHFPGHTYEQGETRYMLSAPKPSLTIAPEFVKIQYGDENEKIVWAVTAPER